MKKKNKLIFGSTIFIILLILGALGLIIFLIDFLEEPHFTIYKEECRNETMPEILECFGDEGIRRQETHITWEYRNNSKLINYSISNNHTEFIITTNENCTCDTDTHRYNTFPCLCVFEHEVCAVEYINISKCEKVEVEYLEYDEYNCCPNGTKFTAWKYNYNLDIEWLKENCECIKGCGLKVELEEKTLQEEVCKEYKCGEYYVETWNQIK